MGFGYRRGGGCLSVYRIQRACNVLFVWVCVCCLRTPCIFAARCSWIKYNEHVNVPVLLDPIRDSRAHDVTGKQYNSHRTMLNPPKQTKTCVACLESIIMKSSDPSYRDIAKSVSSDGALTLQQIIITKTRPLRLHARAQKMLQPRDSSCGLTFELCKWWGIICDITCAECSGNTHWHWHEASVRTSRRHFAMCSKRRREEITLLIVFCVTPARALPRRMAFAGTWTMRLCKWGAWMNLWTFFVEEVL